MSFLLPIFEGFAITASDCAASYSACRSSGSIYFNSSATSMSCPFHSLNRLNHGNFNANPSCS